MEDSQTFSRHEYAQRDFWNNRFNEYKSAFDWYVGWAEMRNMILRNFPAESIANVLMVGCGNSKLSEAMAKNQYLVTNIDISNVVLEQMAEKTKQEYGLMDATRCCFRDGSFDLLVDKGTYDALACETGSEMPFKLVSEMGRVASKGIVIVTHGKPGNRSGAFKEALEQYGEWEEIFEQCELSFQSQFINIVRSSFPGESLAAVVKTPEKLAQCLKEIAAYKDNKEVSGKSLRQTHCWVYIYKRITSN
ncbi:hypothetical protein SteCoe_12668 [Stentor coeruleus]|uniref:Methyltransferase type 11 domain-containing protein n=1 Tax=Stentor coeruleus TaxID=5963 RepID=A0A1R2CA62_9CILI|nr:hypothetical protein SteCoe_12668 [Stentor coeruleus]